MATDNTEQQRAAAKVLTSLIKADAPDGLHPTERAFGAVMNGIKRVIEAEVFSLATDEDRTIALAHIVGFLGETVGMTVKTLPPNVQAVAMTMFANELNMATGAEHSIVHANVSVAGDEPSTPQERLH